MEERHNLELKPIGVIHSPYKNKWIAPYQGYKSEEISQIEVFKEFGEGLKDIEGFSHIIVIYWFHKSQGYHLLVKTPWDDSLHGLFTTRSPNRPSIGIDCSGAVSQGEEYPQGEGTGRHRRHSSFRYQALCSFNRREGGCRAWLV